MFKYSGKAQCLSDLQKRGIPFIRHDHPPVFTVQEMKNHIKFQYSPYIKNLLYVDKKGRLYMIIALNQTIIGKLFWKKLGTTAGNVRFAKQQLLQQILRVKKGNVSPLALGNDNDKRVTVVIDKKLKQIQYWGFHPLCNQSTIQLKQTDILNLLKQMGYNPISIDLQQNQQQSKQKTQKKQEDYQTKLKIQFKKLQNFSKWYQQIITKSQMIQYYDVSGCYILRPWAFQIWQSIQHAFNIKIKSIGVQNTSFPMFVSKQALQKQKDHVEGFAPQVAWVTKSGNTDLKQPIAIRPTSQTIMYPAYAKWIKSHRDLPLLLNQWTNIVRWQFKHPTPFIRTRQFLWQEGHTAHATLQQAQKMTFKALQFYKQIYQDYLCIPVVEGIKTQSQRFAGAILTSTVQTWIFQNGRAIQAATSHNLGQNFSKMFQIQYLNQKMEKCKVWQTSWGISTRSIGILIMSHADDKGLVLPPKIAAIQVVIIPIPFKDKQQLVIKKGQQIKDQLQKIGIKVQLDSRMNYSPGWKFNYWQLKGVPIRLQIGPKDLQKNQVKMARRFDNFKKNLPCLQLGKLINDQLDSIQNTMFKNAREKMLSMQKDANNWDQFIKLLNQGMIILTPWCTDQICQQQVKKRSGLQSKQMPHQDGVLTGSAKTLCIPLEYRNWQGKQACFHCKKEAKTKVYWGRSY